MEAKNYRIGNFVNVGFKNETKRELHQMTGSCLLDLYANEDRGVFSYDPVRLNDDLLKDLGFKYNTKFMVFENGDVDLDSDYESTPTYIFKPNGLETKIKYVHEIQNLFFALTGTELELKTELSACS